jgi:TonB-dependent receptor
VLDEWTLDLDRYKTGLDVYGAYLMLDAQVLPQLRAIGGVRSEITYQIFTGSNPFDATATPVQSNIYQANWLPALSLVYSASQKTNVRAGVSQTMARPQLREVSPVLYTSAAGDRNSQGNPNLLLTKIINADLRVEYFPTLKQVLAASIFYKHFTDPIEEIIAVNGTQGFANAAKADLIGVELEGRVGLDALADALKPFTAIANLTLVASQVELGSRRGAATNDKRPLGGQSPYVANLQLDYQNDELGTDFRVLYNVYGPRIVSVGALSLPDIYELPRHQLDAAVSKKLGKHFELKLQGTNLLLSPWVYAYRNQPAFSEDTSTTPATYTSVGRNPVLRKYQPGATFNLQISYTY